MNQRQDLRNGLGICGIESDGTKYLSMADETELEFEFPQLKMLEGEACICS